jgi:2-hydroxychromene-2-carboxylate isomerase
MQAVSEAKRNYGIKDLKDWLKYTGQVELQWNSHFPLLTILALRISLVDDDDRLRQVMCEYLHPSLRFPLLILLGYK